jgi:hypothetical protein
MTGNRQFLRIASALLAAAWPGAETLGQSAQTATTSTSNDTNVIDMSTIKCSDLLSMTNDQAIITRVWMKGFYSGVVNDTTWDREASIANANDLLADCKNHASIGLMTMIEQRKAQSGGSTER